MTISIWKKKRFSPQDRTHLVEAAYPAAQIVEHVALESAEGGDDEDQQICQRILDSLRFKVGDFHRMRDIIRHALDYEDIVLDSEPGDHLCRLGLELAEALLAINPASPAGLRWRRHCTGEDQ